MSAQIFRPRILCMSEHSQIVQSETKTALSKVEMMNLNRIKGQQLKG